MTCLKEGTYELFLSKHICHQQFKLMLLTLVVTYFAEKSVIIAVDLMT